MVEKLGIFFRPERPRTHVNVSNVGIHQHRRHDDAVSCSDPYALAESEGLAEGELQVTVARLPQAPTVTEWDR